MTERIESDSLAFKTMPKPPRRNVKGPRQPTKFELWAWSPFISFRIGLTLSYLAFIYLGITALIASVPAFRVTAPDGWSIAWAVVMILGGILASIGSVSKQWAFDLTELFGALLLTITTGSYALVLLFLAYSVGDVDRATVGAGFVVLVIPVLVRMLWLCSKILHQR